MHIEMGTERIQPGYLFKFNEDNFWRAIGVGENYCLAMDKEGYEHVFSKSEMFSAEPVDSNPLAGRPQEVQKFIRIDSESLSSALACDFFEAMIIDLMRGIRVPLKGTMELKVRWIPK